MPYIQLLAIFSTPAFPEDVQRGVTGSVIQPVYAEADHGG